MVQKPRESRSTKKKCARRADSPHAPASPEAQQQRRQRWRGLYGLVFGFCMRYEFLLALENSCSLKQPDELLVKAWKE